MRPTTGEKTNVFGNLVRIGLLAATGLTAVLAPTGTLEANQLTSWRSPLYLGRCSYKRPIQLPADEAILKRSLVRVVGEDASGPGIVVSPTGHILTSGKVGAGGRVRVQLPGGGSVNGRVLRLDLVQDLALAKIPAGSLGGDCLTLGRNNTPSIGTKLFLLADDSQEVEVESHQIWKGVAYFLTTRSARGGTPVVNKNGTVVGLITRDLSAPHLKNKALGVPLSLIKQRLCLAWVGETAGACQVDSASEYKEVTGREPPVVSEPPVEEPPEKPAPVVQAGAADGGAVQIGGLLWTSCSRGQEWTGNTCRGLSRATNWSKAQRYCDTIKLRGRNWRLPTRAELESLLDGGDAAPKINTSAFPRTAPQPYWTASDFRSAPYSAWFVNFRNGSSYGEIKSKHHHVRCVAR